MLGPSRGGLALEGREVVFWGPLYPGEQASRILAGRCRAAAPTLAFSRQLDAGAKRLSVRTPAGAPAPRGAPARREPQRERRRTQLARAVGGPRSRPARASSSRSQLPPVGRRATRSLSPARVCLELDDAALQVDTQIGLTVPQSTPLVSDSGAPLLCLALPHGATGLRFSSQTLDLGLAVDASDQLAVRGPLPPGPSVFALRYHLPATHGAAELALQFPLRLPQLSVFVTDTGVSAQATRLHRRRPFRSDDRSYMHLEAFELAVDEPVSLALSRLAPPRPLPVAARAGFALLLAGAATAFLIAPLRSTRAELPLVSRRAAHAAAERESVLAALRDLDEDFATGKLDAADHTQMRSELRARAVALLAAERDALTAAVAAPAPAASNCPGCAAAIAPGARFCSQCGVALVASARDPGSQAG